MYHCNIWWSGAAGIEALSARPTGFLQCFDTVGLVIRPVKVIPEMIYNVLSGTLSLYTTLGFSGLKCVFVLISTAFSGFG